MDTLFASVTLLVFALTIISTIKLIKNDRNLNIRTKNNLIFLQFFLPLIGPVIYYRFYRK